MPLHDHAIKEGGGGEKKKKIASGPWGRRGEVFVDSVAS